MTETTTIVVDNRILILGIDGLYRDAMKVFETEQMLPCAKAVAEKLGTVPLDTPIEGYYTDSPELTEYFKLVRALQDQPEESENVVADLPEFRRLLDVASSPIHGRPERGDKLLPVGRDPLTRALNDTRREGWEIPTLVDAAYQIAVENEDFSLVGLAALAKDSVVLTALRESVVLYAEFGCLDEPSQYVYEWRVDESIAEAANRFIEAFNGLAPGAIRHAEPDNAEYFAEACKANGVLGRCVRIGIDDTCDPIRHYHWAIRNDRGELAVEDFWGEEIWTTERYLNRLGLGQCIPITINRARSRKKPWWKFW